MLVLKLRHPPPLYCRQMKIWQTGLPLNWAKDSIQQAPKCFIQKTQDTARKMPLRLNDLLGVFPDSWRRSWDGDSHTYIGEHY